MLQNPRTKHTEVHIFWLYLQDFSGILSEIFSVKALSESCRKLRDFFCPEEMELGLSWEREGQIGHEVETQYWRSSKSQKLRNPTIVSGAITVLWWSRLFSKSRSAGPLWFSLRIRNSDLILVICEYWTTQCNKTVLDFFGRGSGRGWIFYCSCSLLNFSPSYIIQA